MRSVSAGFFVLGEGVVLFGLGLGCLGKGTRLGADVS